MRQHHYLKLETEFYQAVEDAEKMFEVRKNDRNYQVGDIVHLREVAGGQETGRELPPFEITYVLHGGKHGLADDYCVLQLSYRLTFASAWSQ